MSVCVFDFQLLQNDLTVELNINSDIEMSLVKKDLDLANHSPENGQ